jgi:hypothetical protein
MCARACAHRIAVLTLTDKTVYSDIAAPIDQARAGASGVRRVGTRTRQLVPSFLVPAIPCVNSMCPHSWYGAILQVEFRIVEPQQQLSSCGRRNVASTWTIPAALEQL